MEYPLQKVMTHTIKHIKDEALAKLRTILGELLDIHRLVWVITVPAIWTDFAKVYTTLLLLCRSYAFKTDSPLLNYLC